MTNAHKNMYRQINAERKHILNRSCTNVRLARANDLNKFLFELVVQFYRGSQTTLNNILHKGEKSNGKTEKIELFYWT